MSRCLATATRSYVVFRCEENDMSFPYANLDKDLWPAADWHSLHGLPSAANNWPPNPDEVDFLIQPDTGIPSYYQFAATPQGLKFGCDRLLSSNTDVAADEAAAAARFFRVASTKSKRLKRVLPGEPTNGWFSSKSRGRRWAEKPKSYFGFLPMRTRWRDGEFSSPVAIDFNEACRLTC